MGPLYFCAFAIAISATADDCSENKRFCIREDVEKKWTEVVSGSETLWAVPGLYAKSLLSDDGKILVALPQGRFVKAKNSSPLSTVDEVIARFFRDTKLKKELRLKDVIAMPARLPGTDKFRQYMWAEKIEIGKGNKLRIHSVEGRLIEIEI